MKKIKYITFLILLISNLLYSENITYVTQTGAGTQDGTSWENALPGDSLQAAIIRRPGFNRQVWVAKGTYKPNETRPNAEEIDPERDKYFEIVYGIYGGFYGNETELSQRDIKKNETILSGDIGIEGDNSDNCYHVIALNNIFLHPAYSHIIDGFTITGGNANGDWGYGGGMLFGSSAPTIRNCTFKDNHCSEGGGAIANMFNYDTSIVIENCLFYNNSSRAGGAIFNFGKSIIVTNCTMVNNTATLDGGAVFIVGGSFDYGTHEFTNNIIWGNSDNTQIFLQTAHYVRFYYNAIQDGFEGFGNFTLSSNNEGETNSPYFTDPDNNDWTLQSPSPCIDSGVYWNALDTDIHLTPRPQGLCYDMGAYEYLSTDSNAVLPSVTTLPTEQISATYATLKGNITDSGGVQLIAKGIKYSTESGFDPDSTGTSLRLLELLNEGEFEILVIGLLPDSTYYYRAYCENMLGGSYADNELSFTTTDSVVINPDVNGIVYVKENGTGDGSSWTDALGGFELQNGLDHTNTKEVWVAKGKYIPMNWPYAYSGKKPSENKYYGTTEREKHFRVRPGKTLYGGFYGDETSIDQRDVKINETILSGDIGVEGYAGDNSFHVVFNSDEFTQDAVLDGFTISDGYADWAVYDDSNLGGGIYNSGSSPTIRNCTIKNNYAIVGGGICNVSDAFVHDNSNPLITNTIITGNTAKKHGAGICNYDAGAILKNCLIFGNIAENAGGGISHYIDDRYEDTLIITNCTIVDNKAPEGSGLYIDNEWEEPDSVEVIQNSVFWGDSPVITFNYEDQVGHIQTISHCAITGGYYGEGNINLSPNNAGDEFSPYFSDPDNGNYMIQEYSPLRNAGIWTDDVPLYDLFGFERDSLPDIGCYEYDVTSIDNGQFTIDNCELYQNYPNPFNPITNIRFYIDKTDKVELLLYNVAGQLVKKILDQELEAGNHSILFEASDLNSGMYYYTLKTENTKISRKMLLLK